MFRNFLIIFSFIILIVFLSYKEIYDDIYFARKEIILKQNKIRESTVNQIIYNGEEMENNIEDIIMIIENFKLRNEDNYIELEQEKTFNNTLEFEIMGNEKIDFKFNFSNNCKENKVFTNKGMLTADVKELCEILTYQVK